MDITVFIPFYQKIQSDYDVRLIAYPVDKATFTIGITTKCLKG